MAFRTANSIISLFGSAAIPVNRKYVIPVHCGDFQRSPVNLYSFRVVGTNLFISKIVFLKPSAIACGAKIYTVRFGKYSKYISATVTAEHVLPTPTP